MLEERDNAILSLQGQLEEVKEKDSFVREQFVPILGMNTQYLNNYGSSVTPSWIQIAAKVGETYANQRYSRLLQSEHELREKVAELERKLEENK